MTKIAKIAKIARKIKTINRGGNNNIEVSIC